MDILKVAKEYGSVQYNSPFDYIIKDKSVAFTVPQLEAYTARILDDKEAELKQVRESEQCWIINAKNLQVGYNELDAKHRAAQDLIAMQAEALTLAQISSCSCMTKTNDPSYHSEHCLYRILSDAISASAESVAAWEEAKLKPLQQHVAMMRDYLERQCGDRCNAEYNPCEARQLLNDTKATAESHDAEVEARALAEAENICEDIGDEYERRERHKYPELKSDAVTGAYQCMAAIGALLHKLRAGKKEAE